MALRVLGVIPARGGSKRIPRKNCRLLCDCPLIGYTIRAAQAASLLTDWVVSTEDDEIRTIAQSFGAKVIDRPAELAQDDTTSGAVCRHALNVMEKDKKRYDMVVLLHPTSPIRDPVHIDQAIDALSKSKLWTLASVCQLPNKTHSNIGAVVDGEFFAWDRRPFYIMNGSLYAMKRKWLVEVGTHTSHQSLAFVMDRKHSVDINEEVDFKLAELFLNGNAR